MSILRSCLLFFVVAAMSGASDVEDLVRRSIRALENNDIKQNQYAFRKDQVLVERDDKGKTTKRETWTWDVIGLEGSTYSKLVLRNGKPLSPKEQKQEDEKMRREARMRKEENSGKRPHRPFSFSYSFGVPYERLLDMYDVKIAGEGEIGGRHIAIVAAIPKEGIKPKTDQDNEALNYSLKVWLEDSEAFPVCIEGDVTGDHSRMQKGTHFRFESMRLSDVWLPCTVTFDFSARVMKMFTVQGTSTITFSDYHKFQVDSNIVALPDKQ